jgi:RNA 2',3'-cyclic 3'-phosphodiesterase
MRTFVALNIDPAERQRLASSLMPLRERDLPIRWTREESLHLTLRFLGDIEGAEVERLRDTLHSVASRHEPLSLRFGGIGAFPSLRRANIVWIGVAADSALMALQRDAELALAKLGYGREPKPFRPHVTAGRAQNPGRAPDIERLVGAHDYEGSTEVGSIDLMRSHTGAGGSRYEPLLRLQLGQRVEP